jgi:asparagine synthetase B (glutamine-hydrolysing)
MDTRSDLRIYTDAVGEMGVVFDTRTGIVGSTLPVVLNRAIEERPDLSNEAIMASRGHYALGYTRDLFCERLFPNHRLSLKTLEQSRFWPRDDAELTEAMQMSEDDITDELIGILRRNTLGFMLAKASVFPLSGGQDSRILISSARDHLDMSSIIFGMHHN